MRHTLWTANRNSYLIDLMVPFPMNLSDIWVIPNLDFKVTILLNVNNSKTIQNRATVTMARGSLRPPPTPIVGNDQCGVSPESASICPANVLRDLPLGRRHCCLLSGLQPIEGRHLDATTWSIVQLLCDSWASRYIRSHTATVSVSRIDTCRCLLYVSRLSISVISSTMSTFDCQCYGYMFRGDLWACKGNNNYYYNKRSK